MGCGGGGTPLGSKVEEPNNGGHKVFCVKFQKEMPGLDEVPATVILSDNGSTTTFLRKPGSCGSST